MNILGTVLIRRKLIKQRLMLLKIWKVKLRRGRNFSCSALNPHFKKSVQTAGESSEMRYSCTKSQPLKSKLSEGGFQELSEKKRLKMTITL